MEGGVYSIGGRLEKNSKPKAALSTVSFYNNFSQKWISGLPDLNIARAAASACVHGGNVFVFGGLSVGFFKDSMLNSIEKNSLSALITGSKIAWQEINMPE